MLFSAMLCYAMPCHALLCYAMPRAVRRVWHRIKEEDKPLLSQHHTTAAVCVGTAQTIDGGSNMLITKHHVYKNLKTGKNV